HGASTNSLRPNPNSFVEWLLRHILLPNQKVNPNRGRANMRGQQRTFVAVIALVLLTAIPALSQVARGTIVGSVSDASGAVIPGVTVTITHTGTNQSRQTVTNEQGNYETSLLSIGQYRVTAELPGFKTENRQNITLS